MDVNSRDPLQNIIPFRIKGAEIGRFDSSGNLKIGTTTTTAPTVRLDISGGEARVNSGSATSTALTTTGRIGVNIAAPTVPLDVVGAAKIAGELNMSSYKITNLSNPTAVADAANKSYVDAAEVRATAAGVSNPAFQNGTATSAAQYLYPAQGQGAAIFTNGNYRLYVNPVGNVGIGENHTAPNATLDVLGNAAISGAMTISGCKPRIAVNLSSSPGIGASFNIPPALRSGDLIANKVYFAIRVPSLSSNPALFLRPNGSASVFHSFTQQFTGSAPIFAGDSPTQGFRICTILTNAASGGSPYNGPTYINIVGEFTIIRDMLRENSTTNNPDALTTRLYGTLVQYGNHYIQKWDFQGQAVGGANYDIYEKIDSFFFTSNTSYGSDTSVSVKIEGD